MAYTGYQITIDLTRMNDGVQEFKPNVPGDADYVPKQLNLSACPITYALDCITADATGNPGGAAGAIEFDFSLGNSIIMYPGLQTVRVKVMNTSNVQVTFKDITLPHTPPNYFHDSFTGLAAGTYQLALDYLDASNSVLKSCPSITSLITVT
jgi:hypothetical protein